MKKINVLILTCLLSTLAFSDNNWHDGIDTVKSSLNKDVVTNEAGSATKSVQSPDEKIHHIITNYIDGVVLKQSDADILNEYVAKENNWERLVDLLLDLYKSNISYNKNVYQISYDTTFQSNSDSISLINAGGTSISDVGHIEFFVGKGLSIEHTIFDYSSAVTIEDYVVIFSTAMHEFTHGYVNPFRSTDGILYPHNSEFFPTLLQAALLNPQGLTEDFGTLSGLDFDTQGTFITYWVNKHGTKGIIKMFHELTSDNTKSLFMLSQSDLSGILSSYGIPNGYSIHDLLSTWK
ncbi:hypothetical protein SPONN_2764 [uncultured Candidatus Thioglobus sp.]|nr:hypothetical protein SPONN_2764 [uncultured Candidatus Thioglobus sp.]